MSPIFPRKLNVYLAKIIVLLFLTWMEAMPRAEGKGGAVELKALHKKLMDGYDPIIPPRSNYNKSIVVSIQLHVSNVMGLNQVNQLIYLQAFLKLKWTDEFLRWNLTDFAGIDHVLLPQNRIWKPDIILHSSTTELDTVGSDDMLVYVSYEGRVYWEPPFCLEGSCKLDMSQYPYESHSCPVPVHSWMSDNNTVTLTHPKEPVVLTQMTVNGEYEISSSGAYTFLAEYDQRYFEVLAFVITLKRRSLYIVLSVMLPINLLAVLSVVPFIMPPEESGKVEIAMTVMLSFTVFLEVIDDQVPPTSDNISILVVYIASLMVLSFLSVVGNVTVVTLRSWDEAAGKEAAKSHDRGDNVRKDANVENITNTYSTRDHRESLGGDITSTSTSNLTEPLVIKKEKCNRFFHGTRANKLNKAFLILGSVLLFVISIVFRILFRR